MNFLDTFIFNNKNKYILKYILDTFLIQKIMLGFYLKKKFSFLKRKRMSMSFPSSNAWHTTCAHTHKSMCDGASQLGDPVSVTSILVSFQSAPKGQRLS